MHTVLPHDQEAVYLPFNTQLVALLIIVKCSLEALVINYSAWTPIPRF